LSTSSPDSAGFNLTPPLPGVINPDLALNAALAPSMPTNSAPAQPLGRGWAFNFLTNEFVANGLSPAVVYEQDQLAVWIEKAVRTAKFAHPIYGNAFGMNDPFLLIGQPYTSELVGEYIDQITAALEVHDRIQTVTNFQFIQDPMTDQVYVTFTVVLDDDDLDPVQMDAIPVGGA
jgi:hypothetical protein